MLDTSRQYPNFMNVNASPRTGSNEVFNRHNLSKALNLPTIAAKCNNIQSWLDDPQRSPTKEDFKEFFSLFPQLMIQIFGFENNGAWMTSMSGSTDANALEQLLKPQGKLFQALLAFATDDSVSFIFPSSRLPGNTKRLLASGEVNALSQIYKLKVSHVSRFPQDRFGSHLPDISLNLFEYYIFCFANYAVNQMHQTGVNPPSDNRMGLNRFDLIPAPTTYSTSSSTSSVYSRLFDQYLNFFFPIGDSVPDFNVSAFGAPVRKKSQNGNLFLQILIDFWMNQNPSVPPMISPASLMRQQIFYSKEYIVPTRLTLEGILSLVRHMMRMSTQDPLTLTGLRYQPNQIYPQVSSSLGSMLFETLQRPLYHFLHVAFLQWPLESVTPFSLVVDIWLTWLQPWDAHSLPSSTSTLASSIASLSPFPSSPTAPRTFTDHWIPYVESNFPFYHLFGNFLTIALDFNFLTAVDDTNILQKVILAFSQSQNQLFNIVQSIDQILLSVPIHQLNAYGFNGPPHLAKTIEIWNHCKKLDIFDYASLFHQENLYTFKRLIAVMVSSQKSPQHRKGGLFDSLTNIFEGDSTSTRKNILPVAESLANLIGIDMKEVEEIRMASGRHEPTLMELNNLPETKTGTMYLTRQGREQVKRGLKPSKLDVKFIGDPALKPVCSYENAFLVRVLHRIAKLINGTNAWKSTGLPPLSLRVLAAYPVLLLIVGLVFFVMFVSFLFNLGK